MHMHRTPQHVHQDTHQNARLDAAAHQMQNPGHDRGVQSQGLAQGPQSVAHTLVYRAAHVPCVRNEREGWIGRWVHKWC